MDGQQEQGEDGLEQQATPAAAATPRKKPGPKAKPKAPPAAPPAKPAPKPAPKVAYVRVRKQCVLLLPFASGEPLVFAVEGDILRADDPCLDTTGLSDEIKRQFALDPHDTRFRTEPAPDATVHTIRIAQRTAKLFEAIGFEGYLDDTAKALRAKHLGEPQARPQARKEAGPMADGDLVIPPRTPVQKG